MMDFSNLPLEIKLHIASYLNSRDHCHFAQTSQETWNLLQQAVGINKLRDKYEHVDTVTGQGHEGDDIIHALDRLLNQPAFKMYTKSVTIRHYSAWPKIHKHLSKRKRRIWSDLKLVSDPKRSQRLRKHYRESSLQAILPLEEPYGRYTLPWNCLMGIFFIISLPALEELGFAFSGEQKLLGSLMANYWDNPKAVPGLFQHLTHVQLTASLGGEGQGISNRLVYHFSLLPSMRQVEAISVRPYIFSRESLELTYSKSNVKELTLHEALLQRDQLDRFLPIYKELKRFSYSPCAPCLTSCTEKCVIRSLLRTNAQSLLSLHLESLKSCGRVLRTEPINQEEEPFLSLQNFQKLQLLRCYWSDIIPEKDYKISSYDQEFPAQSNRLIDILPHSLVVLQIKPDRDDAEERMIEYLCSKPPNLRRVDWPCPSDALLQAAAGARVELHPVVHYTGWSCLVGCDCGWELKEEFGIVMPPEPEEDLLLNVSNDM